MDLQTKTSLYKLPKRPRGSPTSNRFASTSITTNFYRVHCKPIEQIHIFKLVFTPTIQHDDRKTRQQIFQLLSPQITQNIPQCVFSGFNIYSIRTPLTKQFSLSTGIHQLTIKQVKVYNVKEFPGLLLHFFNNTLRNLMLKHNYIELGKSGKFFDISTKANIENLALFSGFQATFMLLQNGIYLRVDTAKKIVRNQTVLQFIDDLYHKNRNKQRDEKRQMIKEELIGKIIMTNYGRPRYLKVADLDFTDIATLHILVNNENIPIVEYYSQKYKIKIENMKQPLLLIEDKRRQGGQDQKTYMMPELCLMTGIPEDFDEFRRKKISESTIKSAEHRLTGIKKLMGLISANESEFSSLKNMGIDIKDNLETLEAKVIRPPVLQLGNGSRVEEGKQSFFNLFSQPIYKSGHNVKVGIIAFKSAFLAQLTDVFESTFPKLRINFSMVFLNMSNYDNRRALDEIAKAVEKAKKEECNICMVVIPNQMKTQYKTVKEICLVDKKIISQVVVESTLRKGGIKSIATKILLQLIVKRGNVLWAPKEVEHTMLIAFDTAKCGRKNIVCGVSTRDKTFSSLCSKVEEYDDINAKLNACAMMIMRLIDAYIKSREIPPKQVLIFTTSCSREQVSLYNDLVIDQVIKKLQELNICKPCLTLVLVNTKTSERFFKTNNNTVSNVSAGTVVSSKIVSPTAYDFFMVSQYTNKGSAVPNHYRVVYSDSKMQQSMLQQLIFSQCFNYANWTGSIKVPGILQYAKKCVRFNAEVLGDKKINEELENKPYFI